MVTNRWAVALFCLGTLAATSGCSSSSPSLEAQARMSDQRCAALAKQSPKPRGRLAAVTSVTMSAARLALDRAGRPIPTQWKRVTTDEMLAVCEYDTSKASLTPPTIRCSNGMRVDVPVPSLDSPTAYLVDAHNRRASLPARFLTVRPPSSFDPMVVCASLPSRPTP
jgi:hypothetical protein